MQSPQKPPAGKKPGAAAAGPASGASGASKAVVPAKGAAAGVSAAAKKPAPALKYPTPITRAVVKTSSKNYGVKLSGKAGSEPELEKEYVLHFVVEDPKDGVTSLREATKRYLASGADPSEWPRVVEAQKALETVKEKLRKAGYTQEDLLKLTMDNS